MQKRLFATLVLLFSFPAQAVEFTVIGPGKKLIYRAEEALSVPRTVGSATIHFLDRANEERRIPFRGDEDGISSIDGHDTILREVSEIETRAYGWCYSINGFEPELMPGDVEIHDNDVQIVWFYGFARALYGQWVTQCEPVEEPDFR